MVMKSEASRAHAECVRHVDDHTLRVLEVPHESAEGSQQQRGCLRSSRCVIPKESTVPYSCSRYVQLTPSP